ncbi:SusC/RagA family TonB-linked outer membrane protein [Pseudoflavitalea sp. X16]|uniref:SusC/RagA family TonB-linked outer membrane protein n=1 Tax=Paraflavitalea devenefica TaxID=2716334 RepID=UPI001420DE9A|nr:SusC/RagA family TonB-linked outer membrane protein [Paraflavitalea devenefica]NII25287.1 SusC/RagA family TonB-linked outer membrane protein [Paraflavitalea devenefica]
MKRRFLTKTTACLLRVWLLIACIPLTTIAQDDKTTGVRGIVKTAKGDALEGVSVIAKNSKNDFSAGTQTDASGVFEFSKLPAGGPYTFTFSIVGYESQTLSGYNMKPDAKVSLVVKMEDLATAMENIVVIGYGTTSRKNLTTAIAKVDPKKIPTAANNSIPELLFGRAAGLQVTQQSAQPGGNISMSIRGKSTPLLVVDGVVYPATALDPDNGSVEIQGVNRGGLAGLNPNDIESVEILKDASAAIYGVAAGNGVMLITTKKGKAGRMNISYDASRSVIKNMPYLEPLNARDYMSYYNQLNKDKYLSDRNMTPFGTVVPNLGGYTPKFTDQQVQEAGVGTDWLGQVLRTGSVDNHVLSIHGGSDKVLYYLSGSYFNQVGTLQGSDLRRYSGRMNLTFDLNKFIKLTASINANRNAYSNPQAGWQTGGSGTQGFNALQAALAYPAYLPVKDGDGKYTQFAFIGNPVSLLDIKDKTKYQGVLSNISMDFNIIPNMLTGKLLYGNNSDYAVREFYIPATVFWGQIYRARASLAEDRRQNQTMEATLAFKKGFGNFLRLDAVAGVGQYMDDYAGFSVEALDILDAINTDDLLQATGPKTVDSYRGADKYRSFFTRTTFDFFDKYVLAFTYRRDGADKFFPEKKYQDFPSASIAWKISNESFLSNIKALNLLKLRASYGTTGDRPGITAYGRYSADAAAVTFNNGTTVYIPYILSAFDNPTLQWPVTKTFDAGVDFSILGDRLSGSVDWFTEDKTRLLSNATTPQLSIVPRTPVNGGRQRRTGFEFSINTTNVQTKDFAWTTMANFTNYRNRWVERFANEPPPQYGTVTDPLDLIFVYQTNGIIQMDETPSAWQPVNARKAGSPRFVDQNGDKELNYKDVISYRGTPAAIIGFGNNFRYKNFDLGVFFYGQFGAYGFDYTTIWGDPVNLLSNTQSGTVRIKQAWSTSNTSGTLPGAAYNETSLGLDAGTDTRLVKRDFLRCRNITLGYTFTQPGVTKIVRNLRVFADVQNAFLITSYEGADPEVQASSIKGGPAPYPMARTFSLGIKANF